MLRKEAVSKGAAFFSFIHYGSSSNSIDLKTYNNDPNTYNIDPKTYNNNFNTYSIDLNIYSNASFNLINNFPKIKKELSF